MSSMAKKVVTTIISVLVLVAAVMAYRSAAKARDALPPDSKGTIKEAISAVFFLMLLAGGAVAYNVIDLLIARKETAKASYKFAYRGR